MGLPEKRSAVERVADGCGLPRDDLVVGDDGSLHVKPKSSDKFDNVECAVKKLEQIGGMKMGFVGREQFDENVQ